jgi:hypothetical protein
MSKVKTVQKDEQIAFKRLVYKFAALLLVNY